MPADLVRLLIVDDQRESGRFFAAVAEQVGFATRILLHSLDFDFVMQHWHPNIVALDVMLPERDGAEILESLSHHNFLGPLILMSAENRPLLKIAAADASARGLRVAAVLSKPYGKQQILTVLEPLRHLKDAA
jgi:CheY-like chemotaxis protein